MDVHGWAVSGTATNLRTEHISEQASAAWSAHGSAGRRAAPPWSATNLSRLRRREGTVPSRPGRPQHSEERSPDGLADPVRLLRERLRLCQSRPTMAWLRHARHAVARLHRRRHAVRSRVTTTRHRCVGATLAPQMAACNPEVRGSASAHPAHLLARSHRHATPGISPRRAPSRRRRRGWPLRRDGPGLCWPGSACLGRLRCEAPRSETAEVAPHGGRDRPKVGYAAARD